MNLEEYRKHGKDMVDYIADYLTNIRSRRVFPSVSPGFLRHLLPSSAPEDGEPWENIFGDIEKCIMPGLTHWQSPYMHAYFPALNSPASLLGDMLADAVNCLGFTWASSPACTELETIVTNWLGEMIGLPEDFLHRPGHTGGGVLQTTASEATLICMLAARTRALVEHHEKYPNSSAAEIHSRLIAYCSDQAHSSVQKAGLITMTKMRYVASDNNFKMKEDELYDAMQSDIKEGLIPFYVCATLGTTGACAFDNLAKLGPICQQFNVWLHIDAAYAGSAFVCPEFRCWLEGVEFADSFAFNPSKWLMVHFDCTAMWVKNSQDLHKTFNVEPLYLKHENSGLAIDYMHWQIPLSKRFRALKLWCVIRNYGINGLQNHIREGVRLAKKFEALVMADNRFEIPAPRHLGLVVFRLCGENVLTERLLQKINIRGRLHCVPAALHEKYVIRFTVTSPYTTNNDILRDWSEIRNIATEVLHEAQQPPRAKVPLGETRKNEHFGTSLILANSPITPKIVNGSFAAVDDKLELYIGDSAVRQRVRGILQVTGKQLSLDSYMDLFRKDVYKPLSGTCSELPLVREEGGRKSSSCSEKSNSSENSEESSVLRSVTYTTSAKDTEDDTQDTANEEIKSRYSEDSEWLISPTFSTDSEVFDVSSFSSNVAYISGKMTSLSCSSVDCNNDNSVTTNDQQSALGNEMENKKREWKLCEKCGHIYNA
ncbi:histidine decarboxylase isoform X2 [Pseudomyrmex gracilis]|uniref:histidine decarboxylase isoform X2 n=1 Tax=Pseudomyrmex gracilis TaxID=219809 RepID=UPI0009950D2D|nr:histidine decarboxylase isoform X2 [Pseudomyrmex gracilis]